MLRAACLGVTLLAVCAAARAQDGFVSYVEVDAEHTVYVPPNYVAFRLEFQSGPGEPGDAAKSAADAVGDIDASQKAFREALNNLDLHPIEIELGVPSVRAAIPATAVAGIRLKFSLAGFANPDTGPAMFAGLCDKIADLATKNNAQLAGPEFGVEDEESVVRNVVTLATTDAYPVGDALALALSARVELVESVKVTEIRWSRQPPADKLLTATSDPLEPNFRQISCTAKVHVTYAVRSATP